jgi:hypothetical protein
MHRKVAVAIAAALVLVAAGCGGSETSTTTLSRAALVRRVELACREAQDASARLSRQTRPDPIKVLGAGQKLLVARLEGLSASGSAGEAFDTYKEGVRARYELIEKVLAAPRADRARTLRSVERDATEAGGRIQAGATKLGFEGCG